MLFIGKVWPEPESSAAGWRILQLLDLFRTLNFEIHFCSPATAGAFSSDLSEINVHCHQVRINDPAFDDFLAVLEPALVIFDRFTTEEQFGWRVKKVCPDALRLLDTEDLHFLRAARQKALKQNRPLQIPDFHSEECYREIASIYRCDLSLIISSFEMNLLQETMHVPSHQLFYLPFLSDAISPALQSRWPGFRTRKDFVSIGNFLHAPNVDALLYLKQDIWPLIRKKIPDAELHIYGAYSDHKDHGIHAPESGILLKGRAKSSRAVLSNARVCLAPLRFGAGLKGKLFEAMLCGTPSVTTSIGAEAMHGDIEWCGTIADKAKDIAENAIQLYSDEMTWIRAQQQCAKIINSEFRKEKFAGLFSGRMKQLIADPVLHRVKNFTGHILWQEAFQSKKFLSLWIEAKNKPITENGGT